MLHSFGAWLGALPVAPHANAMPAFAGILPGVPRATLPLSHRRLRLPGPASLAFPRVGVSRQASSPIPPSLDTILIITGKFVQTRGVDQSTFLGRVA